MKLRLFSTICLISTLAMAFSLPNSAACDDWPNKDKGLGAPFVSYCLSGKTCGDYIRAGEQAKSGGDIKFLLYYYWVGGYVTAQNSELERGGNVLGSIEAKIDDFMLMVEKYCGEHPLELFPSAVSMSIENISPVDWRGNRYKDGP